ncbi:MAG: tRNA dihydrouridine synthase DusB [Balneola sp.]|nr:tRNA dihydrouridine synthase DusB [Balneola sp.]|tara:strand:+ start:2895 stop:3905 length:1011 start_codon:yes stop_codon:yes gene_type:complete
MSKVDFFDELFAKRERPLFLAPMEDVSDAPFRQICRKMGADMVFTEFISSEALIRDSDIALHKMSFQEVERPLGIQIFGGREEAMYGAAKVAEASNPDVVDINFGCPVYKVVNKGAGAACLKDIDMMERMAGTVVDAVEDKPVTVKTRLGWDEHTIRIQEVALMLQSVGVKALTIHARTRVQKYKGDADWTWLKKLKNTQGLHIPIIGNGDITSPELSAKLFNETGVDAVMIGRGAIGNPWIFRQTREYLDQGGYNAEISIQERLEACAEQLKLSVDHQGERYGVIIMKKHYGQYLKGIRNGKKLRMELMQYNTMEPILDRLLNYSEKEYFLVNVV